MSLTVLGVSCITIWKRDHFFKNGVGAVPVSKELREFRDYRVVLNTLVDESRFYCEQTC